MKKIKVFLGKTLPLLGIFCFISLALSCEDKTALLPGSLWQWYSLQGEELVAFSRWDSLPQKNFALRARTESISTLVVIDHELKVVVSPGGIIPLGGAGKREYGPLQRTPGLEGQLSGEYWEDSHGRYLHLYFEPGINEPEGDQLYPLEIAKEGKSWFDPWDLIPFSDPPGSEGWQIIGLFELSPSQYQVILKKMNGAEALYEERVWFSGASSPELQPSSESYRNRLIPYPEPEILPQGLWLSYGHLEDRVGSGFPQRWRLGNPAGPLAYQYRGQGAQGVLRSQGDFIYRNENPWTSVALPKVPMVHYRKPVFFQERWYFIWERRDGALVGHTGILVFSPK